MPLYEYHCEDCQTDFTLLQSANVHKEEASCAECDSGNVRPKFSTFASKVQGGTRRSSSPATIDDLPKKDILQQLPVPRLRSEL